ncbi:MAG: hypothetical protein WBP13_12545 [Methylophilaceae bacterium]
MKESIKTAKPYLTVFPEPSSVFVSPIDQYVKHLHALLSIDLSAVNSEWHGKIHLIAPVEPYEGFIGEYTQHAHNEFLKPNWIAFRLTEDSKYELLGDFKYFVLENDDLKEPFSGFLSDLHKHYTQNHLGLIEAKERFAKFGELYGDKGESLEEKKQYYGESFNLIDQLGGEIGFANWTNYCDEFGIKLNIASESDPNADDDVFPISPAGNRFYFIAGVPEWHYITNGYSGADWIVLYYEPIERIAWLTFDYS